jgi:hypothetical protein
MGAVYQELDERLIGFITSQPMFFVATAPCLDSSGAGGHVNVSPKGYGDTFAVIDPLTVAYLDLTGSGSETIAHLRQNGRITIMFCSFDRSPKIVRIYGAGRVILPDEPSWSQYLGYFPPAGQACASSESGSPSAAGISRTSDPSDTADTADVGRVRAGRGIGTGMNCSARRAIIVVTADRISDSCGYSVPVMDLVHERDVLARWAERKSPGDLAAYRVKNNSRSIDGLPALTPSSSGS